MTSWGSLVCRPDPGERGDPPPTSHAYVAWLSAELGRNFILLKVVFLSANVPSSEDSSIFPRPGLKATLFLNRDMRALGLALETLHAISISSFSSVCQCS